MSSTPPRLRFTHAHRLHGRRAFSAVFDAKARKNVGPLLLFTKPNGLSHARLGLSVSRRVGNAVTRSRIKRLLREAFRLTQHTWPQLALGNNAGGDPHHTPQDNGVPSAASEAATTSGYDLVIVVRPHAFLGLEDYQRQLFSGVNAAHRTWQKRQKNADDSTDTPNTP